MQLTVDHSEDVRPSRSDRPTISASEVGDYAYCARSWWLKRVRKVRVESPAATEGDHVHAAAGQIVATVVLADRAVRFLVWAMLVAGALLLAALMRG